jgi:signal transduction histidine kinase/ActR/RegA family two-component response regulator
VFTVLACIPQEHDLRLVLLAALICVTAVAAACGFYRRARRSSGTFRTAWLWLGGMVGGCGVWATHFIAMLAYEPKLNIHYEIGLTLLSWVVAVLGVGGGFALAIRLKHLPGRLLAGGFVGLGVAGMHFVGMAAVRLQGEVLWRAPFVVASIVIGVVCAAAALAVDVDRRGRWRWVAMPGLLVFGIVGLHFTAMAATILLPSNAAPLGVSLISRGVLVVLVSGMIAAMFSAAAALIWIERLANGATLKSVRTSLDALPSGIAFFDPAERLQVWNGAFEAIMRSWGVTPAIGQPQAEMFLAARASGSLPAAIAQAGGLRRLAGAAPEGFATDERQLTNGQWMKFEGRINPDGGMVVVLTDTTAANSYATSLAQARDAAEAANRAKSEFLANISHEIRTPLNGVLGIAEAMGRTRLTARQAGMIRTIRDSGETLDALLADILDLAQVETGQVTLNSSPVRVADLCASVAGLFADRAQAKGLALLTRIEPAADVVVMADPLRLRQILSNLISNAVKFTEAGAITLAASREDGRLRLEVRDTGAGFDIALRDQLFQRFRQADGSLTRAQGGVGLGLPLCQRLAALMGAELDCISEPGRGAIFSLEADFPLAEAAPEAAGGDERPPRVLVVDDNPVNRQVLELILDSAGVDHAAAENGQEAVEAFRRQTFDAVLMDIQMPVMDGLEATRQIRSWEGEAHIARRPILIVSANCLPDHVAAGQAAGADGHIAKPVSAAKVLTALAGALSVERAAA